MALANCELFPLQRILLERAINSFQIEGSSGKEQSTVQSSTISETAVALGLIWDANEDEMSLDEAFRVHNTLSSAIWMPVSLYEADDSLTDICNKHEAYL